MAETAEYIQLTQELRTELIASKKELERYFARIELLERRIDLVRQAIDPNKPV